jgi:hypothetical protein
MLFNLNAEKFGVSSTDGWFCHRKLQLIYWHFLLSINNWYPLSDPEPCKTWKGAGTSGLISIGGGSGSSPSTPVLCLPGPHPPQCFLYLAHLLPVPATNLCCHTRFNTHATSLCYWSVLPHTQYGLPATSPCCWSVLPHPIQHACYRSVLPHP